MIYSYAQNLEDVLLRRIFSNVEKGFYIDVGAFHPEILSVTKLFYDLGWHGINIDPIEENIAQFHEKRRRDINIQCALSHTAGQQELYIPFTQKENVLHRTALASFSKDVVLDTCEQLDMSYTQKQVPVRTLLDICQSHVSPHQPIHFLKIDTEGHEFPILQGHDFTLFRPKVVILEVTFPNVDFMQALRQGKEFHHKKKTDTYMHKQSYVSVYFDGLNAFYCAEEEKELLPLFSIPLGAYDGINLPRFHKDRLEAKQRIAHLETELAQYKNQ